jgi:hypothetical protein
MQTSAASDGANMPAKDDDDGSTDDSIRETVPDRSTDYGAANNNMDSTEGTKDSVSRHVIRVGTFKINGVKKHFAVVPPILIHSQPDLEDLMSYWGLAAPNFILEANESNEHRERIISTENAPYVLHDIFQPGKDETAETKNEEDVNSSETTQDETNHDASESNRMGVSFAAPKDEAEDDKPTKLPTLARLPGKKRGESRGFARKRPGWRN